MLSLAGRRGHFTEADEDSAVASLARDVLDPLISAEPRIARNLLDLIIRRLEDREEHLAAMALHDPTHRIARQLLALGEALGKAEGVAVVIPRLTHQRLADMLGVRRETVSLHVARLAELGALVVERDRFLLRPQVLRRIVSD